jgi:hypothetical protein
MTSEQGWTDKWLKKRSLLELWAGVIGTKAVEQQAEMSRRNQEAENRAVRRKLWKNDGGDPEGDEMGDTILGDVTIQQPAAAQSRGLSPLLAAAIGMAIPGVGIGGYFVNEILNQTAAPTTGTDTTVEIGLGKIGDYLDLTGQ